MDIYIQKTLEFIKREGSKMRMYVEPSFPQETTDWAASHDGKFNEKVYSENQ